MNTEALIQKYIAGLPAPKQADMEMLHQQILQWMSPTQVWFLDGKDDKGKVIANPNIGYGQCQLPSKGGASRMFYQIGISSNTTGISVYVMGLEDKTYLATHFGEAIGKATVSGYCIKFKSLKDIDMDVLGAIIRYGVAYTSRQ